MAPARVCIRGCTHEEEHNIHPVREFLCVNTTPPFKGRKPCHLQQWGPAWRNTASVKQARRVPHDLPYTLGNQEQKRGDACDQRAQEDPWAVTV